uniref:Integrator complex subunit 8 n=1 Tax=Sander lucioperca TaxID=283035 RepID=A0A8D0AC17_SANLU
MSVETADRVAAVTSSRPSTPLQTSWFEFLLDGSLLENHLQKSYPDPTPVQLIIQFLEQASKPSVNEQNQVQPPADNRRNRTLKLLALKVAAHMKWDLDSLEKGLTIPVLNMLLNELLCVSKVPPGVKHVDLDLSTLPPTTAMAVIIYNRWAIRTIVLSSFPEKQTKPGPHQMNIIVQQEKEMTDNILTVLKEQATDSISVLEGALQLKKDFYVHTLRTLDLLAADAAANGETESSTAGLRISADELHCQVHYDLGGIFFQQGCTDQTAYENARDHFRQTKELLTKLDSTVHVHLDEKRLAGYWNACKALTEDCDPSDSQNTPYNQINSLIRARNYQAVIEAFIKDNVSRSLPNNFRRSVLREFLYKVQQGESTLDEVCYKLCVCNAVRDALEGEVLSVRFQQLLLKPSKKMVDFILEVLSHLLMSQIIVSLKIFAGVTNAWDILETLCETLEELSLLFVVSSHKLFMELLKEEERKVLVEQLRKRSTTINLSAKPLPSFYDIPASASVNIGQLEQQLILLLEPRRIRQILVELHGMAERPFWKVNSKWEVPPDYINVILGIKDNLTKDLVYILMAKGLHCISIKDFAHARQLFSACLELVTEFSPKLRQVMLNEMLLLEVRAHETMAAEGSKERPPSDLVSRVRGYLEMRIHDLPLRQVVGKECVAFMLNWRENDYLTLQVPPSLVMNNPYIKLGQLLASTCKELPGPKECRRTAKELWDVVVQICSVSIQHKRNHDGRVGLIKQRESSME